MGKYLARRLANYLVLVFIATSMAYSLAALSLNPRAHYEGRNPPIPAATIDNTRNQYNLGYSSDKPYDGTYRKIQVTSKQKDLVVTARQGYYARK